MSGNKPPGGMFNRQIRICFRLGVLGRSVRLGSYSDRELLAERRMIMQQVNIGTEKPLFVVLSLNF